MAELLPMKQYVLHSYFRSTKWQWTNDGCNLGFKIYLNSVIKCLNINGLCIKNKAKTFKKCELDLGSK